MKIERPISIMFDDNNNDALYYWLDKDERNPRFWAQLVISINYDIPLSTELAHWVVKQEDCDIGTAILVFGLFQGWLFCYEDVAKRYDDISDSGKVMKTICENSENGFYKNNSVGGLPEICNQELILSSISALQEDEQYDTSKLRYPIPNTILTAKLPDTPFPKFPFLVHEGGVDHIDSMPSEMRNMYREMGFFDLV